MPATAPSESAKPASTTDETCFHCGLPVPPGFEASVTILGETRPMCCHGCAAVAKAIIDAGQESYYRFRTEVASNPESLVPDFLANSRVYDQQDLQRRFTHEIDGQLRETSLIIEGIACAACIWLNEQYLGSLDGIRNVSINYASHRAQVTWDPGKICLSEIIDAISRIGYLAHPYEPSHQFELLERQRKQLLRRLGVSALLAAQVMMISVAIYAGDWWGMADSYRFFFSWISFFLTLPVLLYSAQPFFSSAWRDLKHKTAGMDVPVSLGIVIAFAASSWHTYTQNGHLYYDSVVMFVFFLLGVRYLELGARKKAVEASERLVNAVPAAATRISSPDGREETVAVTELEPDDQVLVRAGETVPADGIIEQGQTSVSEAILTGEEHPIVKSPGDTVTGGSINQGNPVRIRVTHVGNDSYLAEMQRLVDRAQSEKPAIALLSNRIAARFVIGILLVAACVAAYWIIHDPDRWIEITVSVLVVTCPCALSLATPAALTAATGALLQRGLIATRGSALETLARADVFVFDKTGTLTQGQPTITRIIELDDVQKDFRKLAATISGGSEHPMARAFRSRLPVEQAHIGGTEIFRGKGICSQIDGRRWCLGNQALMRECCSEDNPDSLPDPDGRSTIVYLGDSSGVHCAFQLNDPIRTGARELLDWLGKQNRQVMILSGDREPTVARVASDLGIQSWYADRLPDQKLAQVRELQSEGNLVCMIGDGINDAPVLSRADVSVAMAGGTHLAANSADMLLLGDDLRQLRHGITTARRMMTIIRQNFSWAIGYNLVALPAAAAGFVAPWMAAIGMSASSLVVVLNALRLSYRHTDVI